MTAINKHALDGLVRLKSSWALGIVAGVLGAGAAASHGQTNLLYCGYQNLDIVMEQVPTSWSAYTENNDAMWTFNEYMDIFRVTGDDGTYGDNGENEFTGFPSSSDLNSVYGFTWAANDLAVTWFQWSCECCRIKESDISFNPNKTWTYSKTSAEHSSSYYYHSVALHELGHVWGMQTKNETYNYVKPTVMHSYENDVVQDWVKIHKPEATLIRDSYDRDLSVPGMTNMGVSSKWADGDWEPTTTDKSVYWPSQEVDVLDLTVENTGTRDLSDVRIRLYLSENRTITEYDHQLGGDWVWSSFGAESWWTGDLLDNDIPEDVCGDYWVGAIVTQNGYNDDDFSYDDTAYLIDTIRITCLEALPRPILVYVGPLFDLIPIAYRDLLDRAVELELIPGYQLVNQPGQFRDLLGEDTWGGVISLEHPDAPPMPYEDALRRYVAKGGKTILSDPRPENGGTQEILRAAGVHLSPQQNVTKFEGLGTLGGGVHTLIPGPGLYSNGLLAGEGAAVYARFVPAQGEGTQDDPDEGDPAIVGIGGRTFVHGFRADALPSTQDVQEMLLTQMRVLAVGRAGNQARSTIQIVPATWSVDPDGILANITTSTDRQVEMGEEGGVVGYAVIADVERTDSDGLYKAAFDLFSADPTLEFLPLNFAAPYHDPDPKQIFVNGQWTPVPAVRPMVSPVAPVTVLNSIFTGGSFAGQPMPGGLVGVTLAQRTDGLPEEVTRGVGQFGNDLSYGEPTVLAVGEVVVPAGTMDYDIELLNASADVYRLDPLSALSPGGAGPAFGGEMRAAATLRIVRQRDIAGHPDDESEEVNETVVFGDCDLDGNVSVKDFARMQRCFTGEGGAPIAAECACTDYDGDNDTDLDDLAEFTMLLNGV